MREEGSVVSDQTHPAPAEQDVSLTELSATHKEDYEFSPATLRPPAHPLLMLYLYGATIVPSQRSPKD